MRCCRGRSDTDRWRLEYLTRLLPEGGEAYYMADDEEVSRLSSLIDCMSIN